MSDDPARRATAQVVAALLASCPPGWRAAQLSHRCVGPLVEQEATVELADGDRASLDVPEVARASFDTLRRAHVAAGRPRWSSARVVVRAPDEVVVSTDDGEPELAGAAPTPADYRADAEALPDGRPVPGWLEEVLEAEVVVDRLDRRLAELGLTPGTVRFGGDPDGSTRWRVLRRGGGWLATATDLGRETDAGLAEALFDDAGDAAAFALGRVLLATGRSRPSERAVHRGHGPLGPRGDDPPLSLLRELRVVVLTPGARLDRLGPGTGTVVAAGGTPLEALSLPPELAGRARRALVVARPVEVLTGVSVAWFGLPGGGTVVVLPGSVDELLAAGVLSAGALPGVVLSPEVP